MNRKRNVFRNLKWGFLNRVAMVIAPFITRTVLIYILGMEYEGIKSLFSSILQVLNFAELGIGSALVFSMYQPAAENDNEKICALLNLYKKAYIAIGCIVVSVGLIILPILRYLIAGSIPGDIDIYKVFLIYLINNVAGYFLFSYKSAIFTAFQRVDILSKVSTSMQLVLHGFQILTLVTFKNYYAYTIILPISTIINNIIIYYLANKYFPQYQCYGRLEKAEYLEIGRKVFGLVCQKIGSIVLASADSIVISSFLGLHILGVYNGYYYIITALLSFLQGLQQAIIPSLGNSVVQKTAEENYKDMKTYHFLYTWLITWCSACLLCLFQLFIRLWQGPENMLSISMVVLFTIFFYVHHMSDIAYLYKEAIGLWWQGKFVPLISSAVNLSLNIIMIQTIGLPGVLISTIISMMFINNVYDSVIVFKCYYRSKSKLSDYWRHMLLYFAKAIMIVSLSFWVCNYVPGRNFISLIMKLVICSLVSNTAWLLFNIKNRQLFLSLSLLKGIFNSSIGRKISS